MKSEKKEGREGYFVEANSLICSRTVSMRRSSEAFSYENEIKSNARIMGKSDVKARGGKEDEARNTEPSKGKLTRHQGLYSRHQ